MNKKLTLRLLCISGALALLASSESASAQVFARDDAAGYTNAPGGANYGWLFNTTTNGGFGFTPWVFTRSGANFQGFFVGSDTINSASNTSWGMYANGAGADNKAVAYRGFTNSLAVNTVFKIKWHTKGIGGTDP